MKVRPLFPLLVLFLVSLSAFPQQPVRNVIIMIPDGTSANVLTLARWYRFGPCVSDRCRLAVDPHLCGVVKTFSSDAPIGDSAPTTSCYATGYPSRTGFIAMYPPPSGAGRDLVPVDPGKAYQPLFTILEAAKVMGKSTGLVVTSEFFHATPADFAAHTPHRWAYDIIARQMVHNRLNVVFGGGSSMLDPEHAGPGQDLGKVLKDKGYKVVRDRTGFRDLRLSDTLVYGLFGGQDLPYDLDRDTAQCPSLSEMTRQAIKTLSQNPNGFFLMVEGSKIDWAAHANDPVGAVTDYLAFDRAVQEAMDFANRDGYTAVIVLPDHATGGITLGNARSDHGYDTLGIQAIIGPLERCRHTAAGMAERAGLYDGNPDSLLWHEAGIRITGRQRAVYDSSLLSSYSEARARAIARIITENSYIGFTTTGHTGDDVFLAVYHPGNYRPTGLVLNEEINSYLCRILGTPSLDSLTARYFCIDSIALRGWDWSVTTRQDLPGTARLTIRMPGHAVCTATVEAFSDSVRISCKGKTSQSVALGGLAVYVRENNRFYIPADLGQIIKNHSTFTKNSTP
jgi:alkaline phosphatase